MLKLVKYNPPKNIFVSDPLSPAARLHCLRQAHAETLPSPELWERVGHFLQFEAAMHHMYVQPDDARFEGLGQYLATIRYFHAQGLLSPRAVSLFNDLGIAWGVVSEQWMQDYERLEDFLIENGHTCVEYDQDDYLYGWCVSQRTLYHRGGLSAAHVGLLDLLGFNYHHGPLML